jgi:hypothetical protein
VTRSSMAVTVGVVAMALVAGVGCQKVSGSPDLSTQYQAVVLTNGQVYFGKLDKLGPSYPTLRDVYYIQSQQNPETKQVSNTLVKRGRELHGPDHMILNAQHILFIEPVRADSQLGKLIGESKKQAQGSQGQAIPAPGTGTAPSTSQPEKK